MERPEPDGRVVLRFTHPISHGADWDDDRLYEMCVPFREMNGGWHDHDFDIRWKTFDGHTMVILKTSLQFYEVVKNSDKYLAELKAFQQQHDHFWEPMQEPADMFGMVMKDSETHFYCGTSKTGEEGCGARKAEGVVICG